MSENVVDVKEMASWLMLGVTRTQQLAKQNILIKAGHGTYKLKESMQAYVSFLKRGGETEENDEDSGGSSDSQYKKHRARLYRFRGDKAEVEAALLKGTSHDAASVARVWADMIANSRVKLLALPTTLAAQLEGVDSINERREIISEGVNGALSELADYRPEIVTGAYVESRQDDEPTDDEDENEDNDSE